jgi:hypothetical protein
MLEIYTVVKEGGPNFMWAVVYLAHGKEEAEKIKNALSEQGILVKVKGVAKDKNGNGLFEILVPQSEADDAMMILTSITF